MLTREQLLAALELERYGEPGVLERERFTRALPPPRPPAAVLELPPPQALRPIGKTA